MCEWLCVWLQTHLTECWSLSIKGHTVTFHCEVFMILYDNAFLPNWLLRGTFYIISELCVHSWFLSFLSKWLFEDNYVYSMSFSGLWFFLNWFHSNLNKQKLMEYIYFGFCQNIWTWNGFLTTSGSTVCSNSPSVHKYCLEIMQFQGPPTWTNIHNTTVFDTSWLYLAHGGWLPPKMYWSEQWMFECNVWIFCPLQS